MQLCNINKRVYMQKNLPSEHRKGDRFQDLNPYSLYFFKINVALCPPNPNVLDKTAFNSRF